MAARRFWSPVAWHAALTGCALLVAAVTAVHTGAADTAPPWNAPASAKAVKNPAPATAQNIAAGKDLYGLNCSACHGDAGDGQGLMGTSLDPRASNFTDAKKMKPQTDGELFWKMNEGRGSMPSFKGQLSDMQLWQLVDYIRTFAKSEAPAPKKTTPGKAL